MEQAQKAPSPAAWDESTARFCNFMLITGRSDDAKRLFRQFVEQEKTRSQAAQSHTDTSAAKPSPTQT